MRPLVRLAEPGSIELFGAVLDLVAQQDAVARSSLQKSKMCLANSAAASSTARRLRTTDAIAFGLIFAAVAEAMLGKRG